jgi:hypothetical protein
MSERQPVFSFHADRMGTWLSSGNSETAGSKLLLSRLKTHAPYEAGVAWVAAQTLKRVGTRAMLRTGQDRGPDFLV